MVTRSMSVRWGVIAGLGVAAAAAGSGPALAQSFDAAVAAAVDNSCAALGPTVGNLATFCAAGGTGGSAGGGTTASQPGPALPAGQQKAEKRLEELRVSGDAPTGLSAGETTFDLGALSAYVSLDYQNVDKDTTSLTSGFNSDKLGGTVGIDTSIGPTVVGVAFSYGHTEGDFDSAGGSFDTDAFGAVVYGSWLATDSLFFDATLGYTRRETDLDRNAVATNNAIIAGTETSSPDADEYSASIGGGYDFYWQNVTFGPRAGVTYMLTDIGAFTESGTSGLEMAFEDQSFDSLTSSVGVQASMAISTDFGVVVPQLSADYIHEFANDQQTLVARFVQDTGGTPIRFQTDSPDRDYFGLGAGLVVVLPHGFTSYANYRALVGDSLKTTQTVTAGLRVEF